MHEETLAQNEVSLRDYFDLLRRRKWTIIQTMLAVLLIGVIVALMSRPVYRSAGRLLITPQSPTLFTQNTSDPFSAIFTNSASHNIETQMQVLSTPELLGEAYKAAGQNPGDPRVNVSINNDKDIDIIDVATEAHTPAAAKDVTNNLMDLYKVQDQKNRTGDLDTALTYAKSQYNDANKEWADVSAALQKFQDRTHVVNYDAQVQSANQTLANLNDKEQDLQAQITGLQAQIAKTNQNLASLPPRISQTVQGPNPTIGTLKTQLTELDGQIQGAQTQYKPGYPAVRVLTAKKQFLEAELKKQPATVASTETAENPEISETRATLRQMSVEETKLLNAVGVLRAQKANAASAMRQLGLQQFGYTALVQKRDSAQETAKKLGTEITDLSLRQNAQSSPIQVLTKATLNPAPVRPKRLVIILLAGIAGLVLGVCFALLQEFLDDRVNAPEDARRLLGVPALGYIPNIDKEEQRLLSADSSGGSVLESYRVLRSNVRFAAVGEPLNSIMVTSTTPGEGKSVTAANLAIAMALDGKKVILVDADLRRPTVHEKFGIRNTPGLTNVLVGAMPIEKALQDTDIPNLKILASGPIPPNPAELLNSRAMELAQEQLKERADIVILDSPPCLSVADAQVLAATVDGLIYVVQLGSTKKSALRHGNELLRQAHAKILGVVYNKVTMDSGRSDYYYGYQSYYHKSELSGKGGSGGTREWEELTSQVSDRAATAIAAAEPATTATARRTRVSENGANGNGANGSHDSHDGSKE